MNLRLIVAHVALKLVVPGTLLVIGLGAAMAQEAGGMSELASTQPAPVSPDQIGQGQIGQGQTLQGQPLIGRSQQEPVPQDPTASDAQDLSLTALAAQSPENPAYLRALIEALTDEPELAAFYAGRGFAPIWTGAQDSGRRGALLQALAAADDHGLPVARYNRAGLINALRNAVTEGDRGRAEVAMSHAYLLWAHDLRGGVLNPVRVDPAIVREIHHPDPSWLMAGIAGETPGAFLQALLPRAPEYSRLMRARIELAQTLRADGWGREIAAKALKPGGSGAAVVALRERLAAMGYLGPRASASYDGKLRQAVQLFQADHGLPANGIADAATIAEINIGPEARLAAVLVAMERLRWMSDAPLGDRHIWVNLPDMQAKIVEGGQVVFQTRAVIGKNTADQRTPEFSDEMEFLVVNPSWSVPRSITTQEYLPRLQRNRNAVSHLQLIDKAGRVVPRDGVDFSAYNARNFPYSLRQPPSDGNALGKVKFMFPNKYNIYLHDTPSKSLFGNAERAYSHGCIRLADPFDFAYALLAPQSHDPRAEFQAHLDSKAESRIRLSNHVPVHLVYYTAWPNQKGRMSWRKDIYGRDAAIFAALVKAGVAVEPLQN